MSSTDGPILPDNIRDIFENKRVLIMGDSIMRGIYRDICCMLTNNSRLLNEHELTFNRHQARNNGLFGDQIDQLHIDRTNSTFNIEKRTLKVELFKSSVSYIFCSRLWNTQMKNNLSLMKTYDLIIFQSFIWDLTRYNDDEGKVYLENLDILLLNVNNFRRKLVWLLLPPSDSTQSIHISNLLIKLNPTIMEKLETNQVNFIDLANVFQTDVGIRNRDGIHFTPTGHRLITEKIFEHSKKSEDQHTIETINDTSIAFSNSSSINADPSSIPKLGYKRIYPFHKRRKFSYENQSYLENRNDQTKTRRDTNTAKEFGLAFGTAWKVFKSSN